MNAKLHSVSPIPDGQTVGDLLPVFANVAHEVRMGTTNPECASCRKPFNAVRKPRKAIRLYPKFSPVPIAFSFNICGRCQVLHQEAGAARDGVLASVQHYCEGVEADQ